MLLKISLILLAIFIGLPIALLFIMDGKITWDGFKKMFEILYR